MTNQRDSSDLLVPIDEAIAAIKDGLHELLWQSANMSKSEEYRDHAMFLARLKNDHLSDLIRLRDAGETHEAMF